MAIKELIRIKQSLFEDTPTQGLEKLIYSHIKSFFLFNKVHGFDVFYSEFLRHIDLRENNFSNNLIDQDEVNNIDKLGQEKKYSIYLKLMNLINNLQLGKHTTNYDSHCREVFSDKVRFLFNKPYLDIILSSILRTHGYKFTTCSKVLITHDIDKISYVESIMALIRQIAGDILKRRMFYPQRILHIFTKRGVHKDLAKLITENFSHVFLFLPNKSKIDADYSPNIIKKLILENNIKNVGLHYSYNCQNFEQFNREYDYVKEFCPTFVRGHYLRRSRASDSFISKHKLIDLTPYNISHGGFPNSTAYPILRTNKYGDSILTLGTNFMDTTFEIENPSSDEYAFEKFDQYLSLVKSTGGIFCFNWHNTSMFWGRWPRREFNYDNIIKRL